MVQKISQPKYVHNFVTGIRGQGEIQTWWYAACIGFDCPEYPEPFEQHFFELTPSVKATVAKGDASIHSEGTRQEVEMGFLPPEVLDLIPSKQDKAESNKTGAN